MPSDTVWLALIAMIGMGVKNYLDCRLLIARVETVATDARAGLESSRALEISVAEVKGHVAAAAAAAKPSTQVVIAESTEEK